MTSENLNLGNRSFDDSQLQPGMKVYFYKPPHLSMKSLPRDARANTAIPRRHQLLVELQYEGKSFNCDISLGPSSFQPKISAASTRFLSEKLNTIEDETEGSSLVPNLLFTSSWEILCSCVACSRLLSRDNIVAQRMPTKRTTATFQSTNDLR
jgi:hypothetical protein